MSDHPTIGELYKAKTVTEDELEAAVAVFMSDPTTDHLVVTEGVVIDPKAAVGASVHATRMLARSDVTASAKRSAVRSEIVMAKVAGA